MTGEAFCSAQEAAQQEQAELLRNGQWPETRSQTNTAQSLTSR